MAPSHPASVDTGASPVSSVARDFTIYLGSRALRQESRRGNQVPWHGGLASVPGSACGWRPLDLEH